MISWAHRNANLDMYSRSGAAIHSGRQITSFSYDPEMNEPYHLEDIVRLFFHPLSRCQESYDRSFTPQSSHMVLPHIPS